MTVQSVPLAWEVVQKDGYREKQVVVPPVPEGFYRAQGPWFVDTPEAVIEHPADEDLGTEAYVETIPAVKLAFFEDLPIPPMPPAPEPDPPTP